MLVTRIQLPRSCRRPRWRSTRSPRRKRSPTAGCRPRSRPTITFRPGSITPSEFSATLGSAGGSHGLQPSSPHRRPRRRQGRRALRPRRGDDVATSGRAWDRRTAAARRAARSPHDSAWSSPRRRSPQTAHQSAARRWRRHGVEMPFARHALQLVRVRGLSKRKPAPAARSLDGARDEHLARFRRPT